MKLMKLFFLALFLQSTVLFAQNDKKIIEIINKSTDKYLGNANVAIALNYNLFSSYTSKKVIQSYNGISISSNKKTYLKIHNTEFINTPDLSFKINHDQKLALIYLTNKKEEVKTQNPLDIKEFLKHFKKKTLKSDSNNWVIELETPVLTQLPYGKVQIFIDKKNYSINKQILYLLDGIPQGNNKSIIPRLEISFKELKKSDSEINSLLDLNKFIYKKSNSYFLTKQFADYKLLKY